MRRNVGNSIDVTRRLRSVGESPGSTTVGALEDVTLARALSVRCAIEVRDRGPNVIDVARIVFNPGDRAVAIAARRKRLQPGGGENARCVGRCADRSAAE